MRITYAVTWEEPQGTRRSGRLELGADALHLEGSNGDGAASTELPYTDVRRFRLARSSVERLQGRPTLLLELLGGQVLKIAGVSQPGIVAELSDRLAMLTGDPSTEKAAIVVPLWPGGRTEVEGLLRNGPPFDPDRLGLVRHEVYVSDDEVIFVFQGLPAVFAERLAEDDSFWNAATAWRPLVRGRARFAEAAYSWS